MNLVWSPSHLHDFVGSFHRDFDVYPWQTCSPMSESVVRESVVKDDFISRCERICCKDTIYATVRRRLHA